MTNHNTTPDRPALWATTVEILTQAARLTRPDHEPDDFADFLATALAAVAGNVGSVERLTAGRPGSWEADHVNGLVIGTVGGDPTNVAAWRTEPVRVPLNVAHLVEDEGPHEVPPVLDFWAALDAADSLLPTGDQADNLTIEEWEAAETAHNQHLADLRHRYHTAYVGYAEQFRAAVDEAARAIPVTHQRLRVDVIVDTNPEAPNRTIDNPTDWDDDRLVWHLWSSARQHLGLPRP